MTAPGGLSYATVTDLEDYLRGTTAPAAAGLQLHRASRLVDAALRGAAYSVDDDGMPADADHIAAMRDAVCEQVSVWIEAGYTPGQAPPDAGSYKTVTIGSVTLSGGDTTTTGATSSGPPAIATRLTPAAASILQVAGLLPAHPTITG